MEHIQIKSSLDSKLQTISICSIEILNILEVIAKLLNPIDSLKNRYVLRNLKSTKTQRDQVDSVVSDIFADVITRYQLLKGTRFFMKLRFFES